MKNKKEPKEPKEALPAIANMSLGDMSEEAETLDKSGQSDTERYLKLDKAIMEYLGLLP